MEIILNYSGRASVVCYILPYNGPPSKGGKPMTEQVDYFHGLLSSQNVGVPLSFSIFELKESLTSRVVHISGSTHFVKISATCEWLHVSYGPSGRGRAR